jgi:mono/diheme cytochrome c family protein
MSHALDHQAKVVIPIGPTSPADGKQMYTSYCAPCHGVDGRGHGPASSALKVPATDLSTLTAANGGRFPENHLVSVLRFGLDHKAIEMPAWNQIFARMNHANSMISDQRTSNLVEYLRTLQVK